VVHRHIGMGGDQLVPAVAGMRAEHEHGDALRSAWVRHFEPLLQEIRAFDSATDLLDALQDKGFRVVLASSGKPEHVDRFLDLLDGRRRCDAWTTSEDVDATKPEPDLLQVALAKAGGRSGVVIGDSPWDFIAAGSSSMPGIGLRTGGFTAAELTQAGAGEVHDSPAALLKALDDGPLAEPDALGARHGDADTARG
jgi:HAD superfamily hydrolase (TIGR01549 family)